MSKDKLNTYILFYFFRTYILEYVLIPPLFFGIINVYFYVYFSHRKEVLFLNSLADVWGNVLQQLRKTLSETTIATWFDELTAVDIRGNSFILHCPNNFKKGYVESLFLADIKAALQDIFSTEFEVVILDDEALQAFNGTKIQRPGDRFTSDKFTFDTFVVGPSNKLAYAASIAVAEHPAQNYNPLLIYGDSGLGKTHLIYAIANFIKKNDPTAKIAYVKGDDLTNELVSSIQAGPKKTAEMREKYRQADLLMVDDVQFIAGKQQTQEEFFHTFNTLYEAGRQIVLTSDRPASEMTLLDDRLRTRFNQGLTVDVAPPDFETRLAIIKNKAGSFGLDLSDNICNFIAQNVTANVRQLEGTIKKIMAMKDLLGKDVDETTATRAIQDMLKTTESIPTPESILENVSKYYHIDIPVICGQQRNQTAVTPRQIAMYLIRSMTNLTVVEIGKIFDDRDHATVLYSIKQAEKKLASNASFAETVKEIKTNITSKL